MELKEYLGQYTYWQKKSPGRILVEVKSVGGWASVFPNDLPKWAHRVRNFFNQEPLLLMRLDKDSAFMEVHKLNIRDLYISNLLKKNFSAAIAEHGALSGDVYKDGSSRSWFQMDSGGAIYHFKEVKYSKLEAILQSLQGQSMTPIFKLISPDRTGGSCETIIKNFQGINRAEIDILNIPGVNRIIEGLPFGMGDSGGYFLGEVNKPLPVGGLIVDIPDYLGSYNYAETVVKGFSAHKKFDIEPHEKDPKGYINPSNPFSNLDSRKFPQDPLLPELKW